MYDDEPEIPPIMLSAVGHFTGACGVLMFAGGFLLFLAGLRNIYTSGKFGELGGTFVTLISLLIGWWLLRQAYRMITFANRK